MFHKQNLSKVTRVTKKLTASKQGSQTPEQERPPSRNDTFQQHFEYIHAQHYLNSLTCALFLLMQL
jgi:hypothetical protein